VFDEFYNSVKPRVVAGNSTTPKLVLERILEDSDVSIRKTAQKTLGK
jgi:hypothetical protein